MISGCLFPTTPLIVNPQLAAIIGLNESIFIQQLHYWETQAVASHAQQGHVDDDGNIWIYNTAQQWHRDNFPFFSIRTIERIIEKVTEAGFVLVEKFKAKFGDHKRFFRINHERLQSDVMPKVQELIDTARNKAKRRIKRPVDNSSHGNTSDHAKMTQARSKNDQNATQVVDSLHSAKMANSGLCQNGKISQITLNNIISSKEREPEPFQAQVQPQAKTIQLDWRPTSDTMTLLAMRGVPEAFAKQEIPLFVGYWKNAPDGARATFDHRFMRHVVKAWEQEQANPTSRSKTLLAGDWEPSPELIERIIGERSTGTVTMPTRFVSLKLDQFRLWAGNRGFTSESVIAESFRSYVIKGWDESGLSAEIRNRTAETNLKAAETRLSTAKAQQPFSANVMDHYDPDKTLANPYAGEGARKLAMAVKAERAAAAGESWKDGAIEGEVVDAKPENPRTALLKMMGFAN